jgi:hypothetical protein
MLDHLASVLLALAAVSAACRSDAPPRSEPGSGSSTTNGSASAPAAADIARTESRAQRKAADDVIRRLEEVVRSQAAATWPTACPTLEGDVLLTTWLELRRLLGVEDRSEHAYNEHELAPRFLAQLPTDGVGDQRALVAPLLNAKLVGVLRITGHKPGELVDKAGKPLQPGDTIVGRNFSFKPGFLDAWLYIVDAGSGQAVCVVKARAKHKGDFVARAAVGDHLDDYLRRELAQTLATNVKKAGAVLSDGEGAVAESKWYLPQQGSTSVP